MNKQVIASVLGGLVIGAAAFVPMEVAALQAPANSSDNSKVAAEVTDSDAAGTEETLDNGTDGSVGTASNGGSTTPAPIAGPTFGSGDDDDDDDDEDDDDHEDREDHDDEDEEDDD